MVRAPAAARDELAALDVRPYWPGDEVGPGVIAVEIDVIAEDETALHITHGGGAIAFGDALVRPGGVLGSRSTRTLGAHPLRKRKGLKEAFRVSDVHRCGVLAAESRAGQRKCVDVANAAAHLHGMLDALMPVGSR